MKIPDDWWEDKKTRTELFRHGYKPPFEIPDDWWKEFKTRQSLLQQGYIRPTSARSSTTISESDSEDAPAPFYSSQPQLLLSPPSKPSSIDIVVDTSTSDVEDGRRTPSTIGPTQVEATPAAVPAEGAVVLRASGTFTTDVEDTGTTLQTAIPFQPVTSIPDSASLEQSTASGINGLVPDTNTQTVGPVGQRSRSGVRTFFKRLFRRR